MVNKKDSELAVLAGVDIAPDDKVRMLDVSAGTAGSKEGTVAGLAQGLGLGKLVAVGYNGLPTWIDPAAADWAAVLSGDLGWIQFVYGTDGSTVVMGHGTVVEFTVEPTAAPYGGANITFGQANFFWNEHWSGGTSASGSGLNLATTSGDQHVYVEASPDRGWVEVQGVSGQTDPLLDLLDGTGTSVFAVQENGMTELVASFTNPNTTIMQAFGATTNYFGTPGGSSGSLQGGAVEVLLFNNGSGNITPAVVGFEAIARVDGDNSNNTVEAIAFQATLSIAGAQTATDLIAITIPGIVRSAGSGAVTNAYGLKIEPPTVGTNKFAIFSHGRNRFIGSGSLNPFEISNSSDLLQWASDGMLFTGYASDGTSDRLIFSPIDSPAFARIISKLLGSGNHFMATDSSTPVFTVSHDGGLATPTFTFTAAGAVGGASPSSGWAITWDGSKWVASDLALAATYIAKALVDAKGDLLTATADNTPARLGVGADDTMLMADAAAATGLKWVASATPSTQAIGDAAAVGTADTFTRGDHKHAMPAFATNAVVLGSAAGAGVATSLIRSDATIAAFDATTPATQAIGDTGTVGTAAFAARRDHKHVMPVAADIYALPASINTQTGDYTLVLGDAGKIVELNKASAIAVTVPPNASVAFPVGTIITVTQYGAGATTITAGAGVTIRCRLTLVLKGQYSTAQLYQRAANEWVASGDLT